MKPSRREFLILMAGVLAGCSVGGTEPDYTVMIEPDHSYSPASLTIPRGSIVAWQSRANSVHTVTADPAKAQRPEIVVLPSGAAAFDSGDLLPGDRWMLSFDTPGEYVYFCRYHELEEMLGLIRVREA
jgi:plastocyanin